MKRLICLAMALILCAVVFTSCGKFDMEKEDLSKYVKLGDMSEFPYEELKKRYDEYREYLSEAAESFYPVTGYTLDLAVKAELLGENGGATEIAKWTNADLKGYSLFEKSENHVFDYGICNYVADAGDVAKVGRLVKPGEAFSFTAKISEGNEDKTLAGKTVKFTVTVSKALPDVYSDSAISGLLMSFYVAASKLTVAQGDNAIVTFTGEVDGNLFVRSTDACIVTENKPVYGFESQLVGHKEGEKLKLTATIPADYEDAALAGKTASYDVEIRNVYKGIKTGDTVKLNYTGTVDGEKFDGGIGENFTVVIGEGKLPFGLEDKLLGRKDQSFTVKVTLPADFENAELSGKEADFAIKISDVYNDTDLITENTDFSNIWELKNALRIRCYAMDNMLGVLFDRSEAISYPEKLLSAFRKIYTDEVNNAIAAEIEYAKQNGETYTKKQMREKLFPDGIDTKYIEENAKEMTFRYLVVKLAQKELGLSYTEKDYKLDLQKVADEYTSRYGEEYTAADIVKINGDEFMRLSLLSDKITEALRDRVTGLPVIPLEESK